MSNAKAINLRVRPLQSGDLSFPVDGIVGAQNDIHLLGTSVEAFDLSNLYSLLGTVLSPMKWVAPTLDTNTGHLTEGHYEPVPASDQPLGWGRLKYDSTAIREAMSGSILFELRAEQLKAALDKAVGQRETMWVQKFERSVYDATRKLYKRDDPNSKLSRLQSLATISQQQHDRLHDEYKADFSSTDNRTFVNEVIKATIAATSTNSLPIRTQPIQGGGSIQDWQEAKGEPPPDRQYDTQTSSTTTRNFDYRHPSLENDAQFERAQISLAEEQLSAVSATNYVYGSTLEPPGRIYSIGQPPPPRYLANDLNGIDLDVKRLQVAYMDTLLVSPIHGVVTGVFRNLGDSVRAAQAVVRVENDTEIYLVGTLKHRGLLHIGQSISVTTNLFDTPESKTVSGKVAAVRGHDSEDELWDLLILCGNRDAHGLPLFPINYNFDFDNTTINVA